MTSVELDRVSRSEWTAHLGEFADANLNQAWEWADAMYAEGLVSRILVRRHGAVVGMAQVRVRRLPLLGYGIGTLYWGPLWRRRDQPADPEALRLCLEGLTEEYTRRRRLALRVTPCLYAEPGTGIAPRFAEAGFEHRPYHHPGGAGGYRTILVDLSPDLDTLRAELRGNWRRHLARAEREGVEVRLEEGDAGWVAFRQAYDQMMQRKRFESAVRIDRFAGLYRSLPAEIRPKVLNAYRGGAHLAGCVFSVLGDMAVFLLGATADAGLKADASYAIHWSFICWLKEHGFRTYDLGGIDPERNPGVHQFKAGFGGREVSHPGRFEIHPNRIIRRLMEPAERLARRFAAAR
jgi:lipid II:glycine glycyltransferase (peptidoglycan interpeptide bridge formation enzyme)